MLVFFALLTLPPGAPLRNPETGRADRQFALHEWPDRASSCAVPGDGHGLRHRRRTVRTLTDVIKAMTKAVSGLGGTILLFLVISQFVAYFNYSNIPTLMASRWPTC